MTAPRHVLNQLLVLLALLVGVGAASAQNGSIKGVIYDSDGSESLPGANVYLQSSITTGTVSDVDGTYIITNIPVGPQVIVISYAGFATQEIPVEVVEGSPIKLDVELGMAAVMGVEVVVTGQALGQAKAINQQLNSDAIGNFISADKIKELPDVNAAEAISRLPGVAINRSGGEGSKVVVRGLDPKFTAISINGVRLPATSGNDRSVDLSLISPELLSGIELYKSPTPDMDGDALGGSINLNILRAPKDRKIVIKGLGGYNDIRNTFSDYKGTVSFADRFFDDKVGVTATANVERFNRGGDIIGTGWGDNTSNVISKEDDTFEQQGDFLQYTYREEARKRQNGSLGVDFALGERTDMTLLGIYSRTSRDQYNQGERYDVQNLRSTFTPGIVESAIELWSGSLTTRHNFDRFSIEWGAAYSTILGETPINRELTFYGESVFDPVAIRDNNRLRPQRFDDFVTLDDQRAYLQEGEISVSSNTEDIVSTFIDFSIPYKIAEGITAKLKFGGKARISTRERNFDYFTDTRGFYLENNSIFSELGTIGATGLDGSGRTYFSLANFAEDGTRSLNRLDGSEATLLANFDKDQVNKFFTSGISDRLLLPNRYRIIENYSLDENVYAGYLMTKINIGKKLSVIPGVRIEQSDNTYTGIYADLDGRRGETGNPRTDVVDRDYTNVLPHLHLKYEATEWFDIRASYSTTLARPDFDYVIPATLVNRGNDLAITSGNPQLEASVSTNYDIYLTAYKGAWGLFSIGAFQKDIANAFYPFLIGLNSPELVAEYGFPESGFGNGLLTTYTNSADSRVRGLEFEVQSNLNWLPKPFNGLVVNFNYSLLSSETTIFSFSERTVRTGVPPFQRVEVIQETFDREVDLVGQAPHILNASLGYDLGGFSARGSVSYQGTKLSSYSSTADKDRFNKGFWRVDAVVKYKLTDALSAFINLNNLTNQQDIDFFRDERFVTSVATFGTTATIGAQFTIR